ncbi:collagen alpha-1(I) chain-like [Pipistrellus kuhlii]|uniref:collagen alpha-1(I) chain-like n=1 Tax=Pipistrellus kuhlii TaxID=59472 RepID=UPI001E272F34|nr:collagen alpha-1(I) chain-like [Pipistrellus kuhlii]
MDAWNRVRDLRKKAGKGGLPGARPDRQAGRQAPRGPAGGSPGKPGPPAARRRGFGAALLAQVPWRWAATARQHLRGRRRGARGGLTPVRGRRSSPAGPGARSPAPGPSAAAGPAAGRGHGGGGGTHLAAPPPSAAAAAAAAAEPAAPGTIFRRRLVLGGGYQPPIRLRQPTQSPASRCRPRPRTPGGRAGGRGPGGAGTRSAGPSALRRGPGGRGPRPVRAEGPRRRAGSEAAPGFAGPRADAAGAGFVIVDSVPSSAGHAGRRRAGEGRAGGAEGRRAGPEVAGSRRPAGKGAESAGRRCPLLTWEAELGGPGAAAAVRRAFPQGELDLPLPRRAGLSEADPAEGWIGSRGKGSSLQRIAEERGLPQVGVWSPAPWAARWGGPEGCGPAGSGPGCHPHPRHLPGARAASGWPVSAGGNGTEFSDQLRVQKDNKTRQHPHGYPENQLH